MADVEASTPRARGAARRVQPGAAACAFLILLALSACLPAARPALPTLIPTGELPTIIALTAQAGRPAAAETPAPSETPLPPTPTLTRQPTRTPRPTFTRTPSLTPTGPTPRPTRVTPSLTPTLTPEIPNAAIEIHNPGPLSRVTSPLYIYVYLKPGAGGKVLFELQGEDRRLLYREIRVIDFVPVGAWATLAFHLDFEIPGAAEVGRFQVSVEDEYGRIVALNSTPLILISQGSADVVPPHDVLAPVVIRQPRRKALIQGGKLVVAGLARANGGGQMMVRLLDTRGAELGARLVEVEDAAPGDYGEFAVEVTYNVQQATPALLVITQGENGVNDVIHLVSLEVLLSP
jgi:hypothetical protein